MPEKQPRGNSYRQKEKTSASTNSQLSFNWSRLYSSPKSILVWGVFMMLIASLLEISFLSYIKTGLSDQSIVDGLGDESIRQIGRKTSNALGLFGAVTSQIFVYRWFGIAALALPLIPFFAGWKLISGNEVVPLNRLTKEVIFYTLWISTLFGYIVLMSGTESSLSYLSGGFGYEFNTLLFSVLKWGSILFIVFILFLYVVFFYNVTTLDTFKKSDNLTPENTNREEEYPEEEEDITPKESVRSVIHDTYDDDEIEEQIEPANYTEKIEVVAEPVITPPMPTPVIDRGLTFEVEDTTLQPQPVFEEPEEESINDQILREFGQYDPTIDLPSYQFPDIDLLNEINPNNQEKVSNDELEGNKERIVETLGSYGINISKIKATIGPTVTLYEIIPEAGVRISKIKNLEGDIALSLAALGIRIIAPMPGRGTIGIEVPNKNRETVFIRSVLESERFQKANYELPIVLGKTISNEIHIADLAKMPHLLMAGATGQGKSVGLNVILASLIYKKHPAQLKFVLVDPKKVELTLFNKLERHFLAKLPNTDEAIITDTKKVIHTLNSLCIEMDSRYDLLKEAAVRNLKEYNAKFVQRQLNPEKGHKFLPYIVLVIDELADLMMTAGKEVETPIARLAQLARAVGIHLVLATQRPSVKVITGLIKANFPARLSYRVTSSIDSRTILDTGGAEQLVGQGDMLLSINSELVRLQCPFIDTREVEDICEFIGSQRGYSEAYALPEYEGDENGDGKGDLNVDDFDNLLPEASRLIVIHQQGSTSLIQRKMKLGYNRAGRIMDQLEASGIVGPFTGSKAREVLFHDLESLEQHLKSMGII